MIESWIIMKIIGLVVFSLSAILIFFNFSKKNLSTLDIFLYISFFSYAVHIVFSVLRAMNIEVYITGRFAGLFFLVGSIFAFSAICSLHKKMQLYKETLKAGKRKKR